MAEEWRHGFRRAVIATVIRLGEPRKEGDGWQLFYGWADYANHEKKLEHIKRVGIDLDKTTFEETDWQEFMGTFHEGSNTVYGIDMQLVLNDGTVYMWRYGRKLGEFLMEMLNSEEDL